MSDGFTLEMLDQLIADFEREYGRASISDSITWRNQISYFVAPNEVYILDRSKFPRTWETSLSLGHKVRFLILSRRPLTLDQQAQAIALYLKKEQETQDAREP